MNKKRKKKKKKSQKRARPTAPRSLSKKMMNKSGLGTTRHVYPDGWRANTWLVPFDDGHARIYHGHEEADNHDLCGPQIFCCVKASLLLTDIYPSWENPETSWEMTEGSHLANWIRHAGVGIFYFFLCDPDDENTLLFLGLKSSKARDVLLKRVPLDDYLDSATVVG